MHGRSTQATQYAFDGSILLAFFSRSFQWLREDWVLSKNLPRLKKLGLIVIPNRVVYIFVHGLCRDSVRSYWHDAREQNEEDFSRLPSRLNGRG